MLQIMYFLHVILDVCSEYTNVICQCILSLLGNGFSWSHCPTSDLMQFISDVIMNEMASQIIGLSIVFSTCCTGTDQRKHQSSASLAFVRGIYR